jgi:hypothetical protein
MAGDVKAGALIFAYTCGRAPEALSSLQLSAPERIARMPALSIEDIVEGLQRTCEEFLSGRLDDVSARMSRDLLTAMLTARQLSDLVQKFDELKLAMERNNDGQPS